MLKFIHSADIHLDSPLRGLARYDNAPADQIRTATRRAFENLVDLAISEPVSFVLICGDLWDGDWPDAGPGLFFISQAARLRQAGIAVYVIRGNHDAQSKLSHDLSWPANVHVFSHRKAQTIDLPDLNVAIHGRSFPEPNVSEDLSSTYPAPVAGRFNIGMLHTCLDGDSRHYAYSPCSVDSLAAKGYDYWALGHIHERRAIRGANNVPIVFPGNIQGRHMAEQGAKGCEVITVAEDGIVSRFEALDVVRWLEVTADITGARTMEDVDARVRDAFEHLKRDHPSRLLAVRLRLAGATKMASRIRDSQELRDRVNSIAVDADQIWLERIIADVQPLAAPSILPFEAEVREVIAAADEEIGNWVDEFADLRALLSGDLAETESARLLADPVRFRNLISRAGELIR